MNEANEKDLALNEALARVPELERRVTEIESRLAEAGRRALFGVEYSQTKLAEASAGSGSLSPLESITAAGLGSLQAAVENIGRALLFDPETPDDRGDETPAAGSE